MKLLICTQKVDRNDPVLGFFHRWIEEFAKHYEHIHIICLQEGEHQLPENVSVYSLGKEKGSSKIKKLFTFYHLTFKLRHRYDTVFVHMNAEYVILGGLLWRLWRKKVVLWRNHARGGLVARLAVLLSHVVLCTSPDSYTAQFAKTRLLPVGIDTDFFSPDAIVSREQNSILFLGRIAPVKRVELFVEALEKLSKDGVDFSATIVGPTLPADEKYAQSIRERVAGSEFKEKVVFGGAVSAERARKLYRSHYVYVNTTPSGSMDKTIFEAMACGCIPVACNTALREDISRELIAEGNSESVARSISAAFSMQSEYRDYVVREHSLVQLMHRLSSIFHAK